MPEVSSVRFVHAADLHLGYRQYGLEARARDFARAFDSLVAYCLRERPDFVVLAGDLFDAKSIEPGTYAHADARLQELAEASIPVIAVEGNHERWYRRGGRSWLWQLSRHQRLRLLRLHDPETGLLTWQPWEPARGFGAFTDVGPVRMFGVEYLGARLASVLPDLTAAAGAGAPRHVWFRIGVLHTGVDVESQFELSSGTGMALDELLPLRAVADYLALGHVHHRYELPAGDPWIFNPGSLEAHNVLEGLDSAGRARGIFDVSAERGPPSSFRARFLDEVIARRPFRRLLVTAPGPTSFDELYRQVEAELPADALDESSQPVVQLLIRGRLAFPRAQFDEPRLLDLLQERLRPLHARITLDLDAAPAIGVHAPAGSRADIEREVVRALIAASPEHSSRAETLARLALDLKAGALQDRSPEDMAAQVEAALD